MTRRLFTACLGTETNSFSPIPTGMSVFENTLLVRGGNFGMRPALFALPLITWRERARALGWTVIEGLAAFAAPAGDTPRAVFESLRDELLNELRAAMPVDAVLLNLHGAMIAQDYPDAEGDLLARVREIVGPKVPIGAEFDLHAHLTELKVRSADFLVGFKEYPHVDVVDRAHEVFDLMRRMLAGEIRPVMAMGDCNMLGIFPTTREPMQTIVAGMHTRERLHGVLSVSLAHGFPWGDTPEVGARALVVTDGNLELATRLARELADEVRAHRQAIIAPFMTIDQAIDRIEATDGRTTDDPRPLVLADVADNPGIGSAGDSTFVLARLIERKVGGVAISPLWDPLATQIAFDGGEGARLAMRIGGKLGPGSGAPVDAPVQVIKLVSEGWQPFAGSQAPLGRMAWLRLFPDEPGRSIEVIVNDHRMQSLHPACFTAAGLEPSRMRALLVKSTQHFHAGFAPIAREVLYVSAPGSGSMDMKSLPLTRLTRSLWPRQ